LRNKPNCWLRRTTEQSQITKQNQFPGRAGVCETTYFVASPNNRAKPNYETERISRWVDATGDSCCCRTNPILWLRQTTEQSQSGDSQIHSFQFQFSSRTKSERILLFGCPVQSKTSTMKKLVNARR